MARGERPIPPGVSYEDLDAWNAQDVDVYKLASEMLIDDIRRFKEQAIDRLSGAGVFTTGLTTEPLAESEMPPAPPLSKRARASESAAVVVVAAHRSWR